MKRILLFCFICSTMIFTQSHKQVKIFLNDIKKDAVELGNIGLSFEHAEFSKDNSVIIFVSDDEFERLQLTTYNFEVLIDDWDLYYNSLPTLTETERANFIQQSKEEFGVESFGFGSMGGYYTFTEIVASLDSMYAHFPNLITQKFSIGTTHEGRTIWAVKISDNPNVSENEPQVGYDALIHAREPQSMATLMYFMWSLLENYGSDPNATYLVNNREMFFVPCLNPDGYEYNRSTNSGGGGMWRKNRRNNSGSYGVDLNRNYGYQWGYDNSGSSPDPTSDTYRGPFAFSEPETNSLKIFINTKRMMTYLNMHSYQNAYLYPWGYIDLACPDAPTYLEYCAAMASYNNFVYGTGSQILGYNSNGSARDWLYGEQTTKNKIFGYTMEIGSSSDGFWPQQSRIFPIAQASLGANMYNAFVAGEFVKYKGADFHQQFFNPGDQVTMNPILKNFGLSTGYNIQATLTSLSQYVTVQSASVQADSITARSEVTVAAPFQFTISTLAPLAEEIKLLVTTSLNGTELSKDTVKLFIGTAVYKFVDTTNNPSIFWTITATPTSSPKWEATTTSFVSSPNSYTDSKSGNYVANATVTMTLSSPINLTNSTSPKLSFWTKYDIEANWDYGQVEVSSNNGSTWTALAGRYTEPGTGSFQPPGQPLYDGTRADWVKEEMNLNNFIGQNILIRFKLRTDGSQHKDGWYVDDIAVYEYAIVPVELVSFIGRFDNGNVELNWTTSSEKNNLGFEILRSTENQEFEKIGFVKGNGTTTEIQNYSFVDNAEQLPTHNHNLNPTLILPLKYKLRQVDLDGSFSYSNEIAIEVDDNSTPKEFKLYQNYPNPFNPTTIISYQLSTSGNVTLKIYDVLGNEVATLVNEEKEPGVYHTQFSLDPSGLNSPFSILNSQFPSGVYFYQLRAGNFTATNKMLILK